MLEQELQTEYYVGINAPAIEQECLDNYLCDRCNTQPLTEYEYIYNSMTNGFKYCTECRNYIELKRYKCIYCNNSWSRRSERILPFECKCGGLTVCLTK